MQDNFGGMYAKTPAYIYGFHGCSRKTYENTLMKNISLPMSENEYDWLGHGIYFWENSYQRAVEWAYSHYGEDGRVIGAFLDLGYCLDLTDFRNADILKQGYSLLKDFCEKCNEELPVNKSGGSSTDKLVRNLDCAVMETVHGYIYDNNKRKYDSVRGTFEEGKEMYPGAGFKEKTHTQVCIINPNCIKGFFIPREITEGYDLP